MAKADHCTNSQYFSHFILGSVLSFRDTRESSRYAAKQHYYLSSTLRIGFSREIVKQGFLLCGVYNGKTSLGDTACGVNSIFQLHKLLVIRCK